MDYTQRLPSDLTQLLCWFLDGSSLELAVTVLDGLKRYNHPEHKFWMELYRRDYSTLPLESANYRQRYLASYHQLAAEGLVRDPTAYAVGLTEWGYDSALRLLHREAKETSMTVGWSKVTLRAAQKGHLHIIKDAERLWWSTHTNQDIMVFAGVAYIEGKTDVADYLKEKHARCYPEHAENMAVMFTLAQSGMRFPTADVFQPLEC